MATTAAVRPLPRQTRSWRRRLSPYLYLVPALAVMAIITFYPLVFQVWMSFTDFGPKNFRVNNPIAPNFIGVQNYTRIAQSNLQIPNFEFIRLVLFNLVAMPFYILLLVTGIGPFILFVIVNGLAFGRDVADLAAARHGDRASRRAWIKSTRGEQGLIGTFASALFLVPIVNLAAPVIGAAAAIHLFNRSFWATNNIDDSTVPRRAPPTVTGER